MLPIALSSARVPAAAVSTEQMNMDLIVASIPLTDLDPFHAFNMHYLVKARGGGRHGQGVRCGPGGNRVRLQRVRLERLLQELGHFCRLRVDAVAALLARVGRDERGHDLRARRGAVVRVEVQLVRHFGMPPAVW